MITDQKITRDYALYHGDTVEVSQLLPDDSIHFCIFSPPFESLYTFSDDIRDMSNSATTLEFWGHFQYLITEQLRVMMPGRLIAIHCMNLPTSKAREGTIGIRDYRGEVIREYLKSGFIYHSEVCIWKDPVTAMYRTKAHGLLHKTLVRDSSMSRQGVADYLVVMRTPGENQEPISGQLEYYVGSHEMEGFTYDENGNKWLAPGDRLSAIDIWQRYASPVWMDIRQTDVLKYMDGRDPKDEKHVCPLQLDVIERAMQLWSMPGDTVWSPFMGIGSEGYVAVQMRRKFIGAELKSSYYNLAVRNIGEANVRQRDMFE